MEESGILMKPLAQIPSDLVSLADYERFAPNFLQPDRWAYLSGGAMDECGLRKNVESYRHWEIVPRVLTDMTGAEVSTNVAGQRLLHPVLIAPMAAHRLFHEEGERATVAGAGVMGAGVVLSCRASVAVEEIPREPEAPLWFQLYVRKDRNFMEKLVRRLEAAGCDGLVVTVDAPISGIRNRQDRAGFSFPQEIGAPNMIGEPDWPNVESALDPRYLAELPSWEDIEWLRGITSMPLWLKGVLTGEDARRALDSGANGIIVSNHGGRTIDGLPTPLNVLPEIVAAVAGRAGVVMDGGIRRGTDVFIALALGADAVMVGRPALWGLSVAGALGVAHVMRILLHELEVTMLLAGCRSIAEIRGRVREVR